MGRPGLFLTRMLSLICLLLSASTHKIPGWSRQLCGRKRRRKFSGCRLFEGNNLSQQLPGRKQASAAGGRLAAEIGSNERAVCTVQQLRVSGSMPWFLLRFPATRDSQTRRPLSPICGLRPQRWSPAQTAGPNPCGWTMWSPYGLFRGAQRLHRWNSPRGCLNSIHVSSSGERYLSRGYIELLRFRFTLGEAVSRRNPNRSQSPGNARTG